MMRKILTYDWVVKDSVTKEPAHEVGYVCERCKFVKEKTEIKHENTRTIIDTITNVGVTEDKMKGMDAFRMMHRFAKAIEKSKKTNTIDLEEVDYSKLKDWIEKHLPSKWGKDEDVYKAISLITDCVREDQKSEPAVAKPDKPDGA